jgi:hypothetical protein
MAKSHTLDDANKAADTAAAQAGGEAANAEAGAGAEAAGTTANGEGGEDGTQNTTAADATAGSADAANGEGSGEASGEAAQGAAEAGGDEEMGKSFTLVLENGEEVEAVDASLLLKSLQTSMASTISRIDASEGEIETALTKAVELLGVQSDAIGTLTKSFAEQGQAFADQSALVAEQNEMIKSLRTDLDALRNQPGGRKSVANPAGISADDPMVKSLAAAGDETKLGLPPQEFLAKCLALQTTGGMSLHDVAVAEASIGNGVAVPQHIVAKVFAKPQ